MDKNEAEEKKKNVRYLKNKDGFDLEVTDPIQDIMSDEELAKSEARINALLEGDDSKTK
jgi:hypothetical protein